MNLVETERYIAKHMFGIRNIMPEACWKCGDDRPYQLGSTGRYWCSVCSEKMPFIPYYTDDIEMAFRVKAKIAEWVNEYTDDDSLSLGDKIRDKFNGFFTYWQIDPLDISPENICAAAVKAIEVKIGIEKAGESEQKK